MDHSIEMLKCTSEYDEFAKTYVSMYDTREETCRCAEANLAIIRPTSSVLTDTVRIPFINNIIDKSKIALLSLTEEISNLDRQFGRSQKEFDLNTGAKSCLLDNSMNKDDQNSVFHCENDDDSVISKTERKKISQQLFESFKNEMVYAKKGLDIPKGQGRGLIDRKINQNSCNDPAVSDEFISDLRDKSVEEGLVDIVGMLQTIEKEKGIDLRQLVFDSQPHGVKNKVEVSLNQILKFVEKDNYIAYKEVYYKRKDKILKSPLLRAIVNDPTKYDEIIKLKADAKGNYPDFTALKESLISDEKFRADKLAELNEKCDHAVKAIRKSLCVKRSDNIFPSDHQKVSKILQEMEDSILGEKNDQIKYWASSALLQESMCKAGFSEKPSVIKDLNELLANDLTSDFAGANSFQDAITGNHKKEVTTYANYVCELLSNKDMIFPRAIKTEEKAKIEASCKESDRKDCVLKFQIKDYCEHKVVDIENKAVINDCIGTVMQANEMINGQDGLKEIAKTALEERAKAEGKDAVVAKKEIENLSTKDLMDAYRDVKEYASASSTNLTAQVFNIKTANLGAGTTAVSAASKSETSSESSASQNQSRNLSGASSTNAAGAVSSFSKNFNIGNFSPKRQNQLANFSKKSPPTRTIPDPVDVFKPGSFPDDIQTGNKAGTSSTGNRSSSSASRNPGGEVIIPGTENYKIAEQNYNDHSDRARVRGFDFDGVPNNPVKTQRELLEESYNNALGAAYEAKKKGFDPAAVSGVSIKPPSSDGAGADGGSLSIAGVGGANGKGFDGAFDSIIANAQVGLDSEQYQKIRDFFLSDKKELEIASFEDPKRKVILRKEPVQVATSFHFFFPVFSEAHASTKKKHSWKIKVVPAKTSNEADEGFVEFYQNIKNSRHVKNNFKDFIAAMDEKSVYNEMLKLFNETL